MRVRLPDLLRQAMEARLADVHTAIPGRIERYAYRQQRAEVKPLISRQLTDGRVIEQPVITNVRVLWPVSGGASLTMPVRRGDGCLLVFSEASLDRWLEEGNQVVADDPRRHSLQDAVAIMGLGPFSAGTRAENNEDVLLAHAGSRIRLKGNGDVEVESAGNLTGNIAGNAELEAGGDLNASAGGNATVEAGGNVTITGAMIDLNP